jgi:hypothetical protein
VTARLALALLVAGCAGAATGGAATSAAAVQCGPGQAFDGTGCRALGGDRANLDKGESDLAEFRAEEAASSLERARRGGPYAREDYARIFENLGIAYSYLGREEHALEAFDMLLTLMPGHAISYTLSPRATFLFERAREQAKQRPEPRVRVTWPRGVKVDEPLPIEVEVVDDPRTFLARARLFARREGESGYHHIDLDLGPPGSYQQILLPPVAPEATSDQLVQLYLSGFDPVGNEVFRWGSPDRPAEVGIDYRPPTRWYRNWWIWTIGAAVVGTATGVTVYAVTREPSPTLSGPVTIISE